MLSMDTPIFEISGFEVLLWHIIVAVAAVLAIVLVCVIVAVCHKKFRAKRAERAVEESSETTTSQQIETQDEQPAEDTVVVSEDQHSEIVASVSSEQIDGEEPAEDQAQQSQNNSRPKNYHVSLREDGKWQVKLGKGERALKLFDTQAEAIAFAKEKAKNQDGHITIHKVDGKIRKQRY